MRSSALPYFDSRQRQCSWEGLINATPEKVYEAWTSKFDLWFGQPGETFMTPEVDKAYFFYNKKEWGRHPHYGRFTELVQNKIIEMTWLTGNGDDVGTEGAETLIRVELEARDNGTFMKMTHSGFKNERSQKGHDENWPYAFEELEKALNG